ncbi:hypothetical protein SedNR2807_01760 [Citrobacter sedlakii]
MVPDLFIIAAIETPSCLKSLILTLYARSAQTGRFVSANQSAGIDPLQQH